MESAAQFEMVGVEMEDNNCIEFYFGSVARVVMHGYSPRVMT